MTALHLKSFIWLHVAFCCSVAIRAVTSTLSRISAAWWCKRIIACINHVDCTILLMLMKRMAPSSHPNLTTLMRFYMVYPKNPFTNCNLHISRSPPVLKQLCWLPRSGLCSKSWSLHRLSPPYLTQSPDTYTPSCPLMLSSASLLPTPPMCICFEFSYMHECISSFKSGDPDNLEKHLHIKDIS